MAKQLRVTRDGEWTVTHIEGNPEKPEAAHAAMIKFPGGNVNVTRTTQGDYWVHINVNRSNSGFFIPGETIPGRIIDGRVDIVGEGVKSIGDMDCDHIAFKIASGEEPPTPAQNEQSRGEIIL